MLEVGQSIHGWLSAAARAEFCDYQYDYRLYAHERLQVSYTAANVHGLSISLYVLARDMPWTIRVASPNGPVYERAGVDYPGEWIGPAGIPRFPPGEYTVTIDTGVTDIVGSAPIVVDKQAYIQFALGVFNFSPSCSADANARTEFVDYNPAIFAHDANPTVAQLAQSAPIILGAAADGVTEVLVRAVRLSHPGTVTFSLTDENDSTASASVGVLRNPLTGQSGSTITVPCEPIGSGEFAAFAVWTTPLDFVRTAEDEARGAANPRRVFVTVGHSAAGACYISWYRQIDLHRPPIVLVHGLEGFPQDWGWSMQTDPRFDVTVADYRESHARPFVDNRMVVGNWIRHALQRMRDRGIAVTQADVFGHSMGGLLTRLYMLNLFTDRLGVPRSTGFLREDNLELGDIHKLITVNTPHGGSQVSDLLVLPNGNLTPVGEAVKCWLDGPDSPDPEEDGRCTDCGAVFDLATWSPMLAMLNSASPPIDVPCHAIIGNGGLDLPLSLLDLLPCVWPIDYPNCGYYARTFWSAVFCGHAVSDLFHDQNDLVVSAESQRGGLVADTAYVSRFSGDASWHWPQAHDNQAAGDRAVELLNASARFDAPNETLRFYAGFPGIQQVLPAPEPCLLNYVPVASPRVTFSMPLPESVYASGDVVTIALYWVSNGVGVDSVTLHSSAGGGTTAYSLPLFYPYAIPLDAAGVVEFSAFAIGSGLPVGCKATVRIRVQPNAPTTNLTLDSDSPHPILDTYRPTHAMRVTGMFGDGISRDVTEGAAGTTYGTSAPHIATISVDGVITGHHVGSAIITATHGGQVASMLVSVRTAKGDVNSDGLVDSIDATAFVADYSGPAAPVGYTPPRFESADVFDFDGDGDIDCADWVAFHAVWTGPPAAPPSFAACRHVGDMNCDAGVNFFDIDPFILALFDPTGYVTAHPNCNILNADMNADGLVNFFDIDPFIACLFGTCP